MRNCPENAALEHYTPEENFKVFRGCNSPCDSNQDGFKLF